VEISLHIMAATEPVSSTPPETPSVSTEKQEKITKVDKPDEEKFKKDLAEADKQLSVISEKLVPCQYL
jgi:hypothetical protein